MRGRSLGRQPTMAEVADRRMRRGRQGKWPGQFPCPPIDQLPPGPIAPEYQHCYDRLDIPPGPYERNWKKYIPPGEWEFKEGCFPGSPTWPGCQYSDDLPRWDEQTMRPTCLAFEVLRVRGQIGGTLRLRVEVTYDAKDWNGRGWQPAGQMLVKLTAIPLIGPTPPKVLVKTPEAGLINTAPTVAFPVPYLTCLEPRAGLQCAIQDQFAPPFHQFPGPWIAEWKPQGNGMLVAVQVGNTAEVTIVTPPVGVFGAWQSEIEVKGTSAYSPTMNREFDVAFRLPMCKPMS